MFSFKKNKNLSKKILVLGDKNSGKHCCVYALIDGKASMDKKYDTKELFFATRFLSSGPACTLNFVLEENIDFSLTDLFKPNKKYDLILIVTDLSSKSAIESIEYYKEFSLLNHKNVPIIFVGTKSDIKLPDNSTSDILQISALTGDGVGQLNNELQHALGLSTPQNKKQLKL